MLGVVGTLIRIGVRIIGVRIRIPNRVVIVAALVCTKIVRFGGVHAKLTDVTIISFAGFRTAVRQKPSRG